MKQKCFWIGAGIGFALILIKLCACTWNADLSTIEVAISTIEKWNDSFLNPTMCFYLILTICPMAVVLMIGFLGELLYCLYRFLFQKT